MIRSTVLHRQMAFLLALVTAPVVGEEVYRRVIPTDVTTGVVRIRQVFTIRLDLPVRCADGGMACTEQRVVPSVYRIDFVEERRGGDGGGPRLEAEEKGTVLMALDMEAADAQDYDDLLRRVLSGLSARAFRQRFAGRAGQAPFDRPSIATRSRMPSWLCLDGETALSFSRRPADPAGSGEGTFIGISTGFSDEETVAPLCAQLVEATAAAPVEEVRTMPAPGAVVEESAGLLRVDRLQVEPDADEVLTFPEGVGLSERPAPGAVGGESRRGDAQGCVVEATWVHDEREIRARAAPMALPLFLLDENAWIARWELRRTIRRLGIDPESDERTVARLSVALVPTEPPRHRDGDAAPDVGQVVLDDDLLVGAVAERLDASASLDHQALYEAVTRQPQGLVSPGWLLLVCGEDGSAEFFLPPTGAHCRVTNAVEACTALDRAID
ncbi:MAG: hypothetical protein Q9Q40_00070 [Acidobacteriota bacterium]|nr:hypothetical protein [Acidobacteriota bacterium]